MRAARCATEPRINTYECVREGLFCGGVEKEFAPVEQEVAGAESNNVLVEKEFAAAQSVDSRA